MFCPSCGNAIPEDSNFCKFCGANLGESSVPMSRPPLLVEEVFDPHKGWEIELSDFHVTKSVANDGNPYFVAMLAGIELMVYQQTQWAQDSSSNAPPDRIVVTSFFSGYQLNNPIALLEINNNTRGITSFALQDGMIVLHATFPVGPGFPLDIARKQVLVCMGLVAEDAAACMASWSGSTDQTSTNTNEAEVNWGTVQNVAQVAGVFLRAFFA